MATSSPAASTCHADRPLACKRARVCSIPFNTPNQRCTPNYFSRCVTPTHLSHTAINSPTQPLHTAFNTQKITKVKKGIIYGETFRRILILLRVCGVVHLQSIFDVDEVLQPIANVHGEDFDAWAEKAAEKNADFASTNVEWANVASRGSSRYGRERGELVHTKNTHGRVRVHVCRHCVHSASHLIFPFLLPLFQAPPQL